MASQSHAVSAAAVTSLSRKRAKATRNSSSMAAPMPSVPSATGLVKRAGRA